MKIPGPDHPIAIEHTAKRVVVKADGRVLADTRAALGLVEASYPAVQYVPRADADMSRLRRSAHTTYCPYKGDCSYFDIVGGAANAVWSYERPYPAVAGIEGHLAFYPDRVDSIEIS